MVDFVQYSNGPEFKWWAESRFERSQFMVQNVHIQMVTLLPPFARIKNGDQCALRVECFCIFLKTKVVFFQLFFVNSFN